MAFYRRDSGIMFSKIKYCNRVFPFMFLFLLFAIVFFTYFHTLRHFFLADDASWILHSRNIGNTFKPINGYLRPATVLYFFLMHYFFNLSPLPYHCMNIFVHLVNTVLLFFLCCELKKFYGGESVHSGQGLLPVMASLFTAVSICFFAAVIWVSSIHDLFMTTFILLSLLFLIKGMRIITHAGSFLPCYTFYLIALLFKEHAVVVVAAVFPLIFFSHLRQNVKIGIFAGYIVITLLYDVFYHYFNAEPNMGSISLGRITLQNFAVLSAESCVSFFGISFHPRIQESYHPAIFYWAQKGSLISFVFITLSAVCTKSHIKNNKIIMYGMYLFVVCLMPVCFFSYVGNPLAAFSARYRYLYLPFFGLSMTLAALLETCIYSARLKTRVLMGAICFLFLSCVLFMNIQLNNIPIRDYGRFSELNASLVQKIVSAYKSTRWNKVVVVDDFPSHAVIPLALPHYLQLYANQTFKVHWLSRQVFSSNRDVSLLKDCVFIVAEENQFVDKTNELKTFLRGIR